MTGSTWTPEWSDALASTTSVIFGITYLFLAIGEVPRPPIDRAGIALVGVAAIFVVRVLGLDEAARAVDVPTIVLLFGMMIVVAFVRLLASFAVVTSWIATRRLSPHGLLAMTIGMAGLLSAFLVNDVVCVAMTPLVLDLCRRRNLSPVPYLIGLATASNIGSVATITGNPQNIIIGNLSDISYVRFAARLAPMALLGLALDFAILSLIYSRSMATGDAKANGAEVEVAGPRVHRGLLVKALCVTAAPKSRGRSDAQTTARARPDREGAAQPSVARQGQGPPDSWSGRAPVS